MIANPRSELLREPNLLVPGKKPVGPVKIDWNHPLARGLIEYILATNIGMVKVINPSVASAGDVEIRQGTPTWNPNTTTLITLNEPVNISGGRNFSLMQCWVNVQDNWKDNGCLRRADHDSNHFGQTVRNGTNLYYKNMDVSVSDSPYVEGEAYVCVSTADYNNLSNAIGRFYTNGAFVLEIVSTRGYTYELGLLDYDDTTATMASAVWKRTLNDEEALSMTRDPYQFLIPA